MRIWRANLCRQYGCGNRSCKRNHNFLEFLIRHYNHAIGSGGHTACTRNTPAGSSDPTAGHAATGSGDPTAHWLALGSGV
jgi:hypothetical protein